MIHLGIFYNHSQQQWYIMALSYNHIEQFILLPHIATMIHNCFIF